MAHVQDIEVPTDERDAVAALMEPIAEIR